MDVELGFLPHLVNPVSMRDILDAGVRREHFGDDEIGDIFAFSMSYYIKSDLKKAVTKEMLTSDYSSFFSRRPWPEEEYVLSVLIDRLFTTYRREQAKEVISDMASEIMENPLGAIGDGVGRLVQIQVSTSEGRAERYSDRYMDRIREYNDRILAETDAFRFRGFPLGWPEVSEHTYGLKRREVAIVVARIQVGKSWMLDKIALEAAKQGHRVYLASLENSKEMTMMRLDCLASGVSYEAYERGLLKPEDFHKLEATREVIEALGDRLIVDAPSVRTDRTVPELYSRARSYGAELFVGDQLSWVRPVGNFRDEHDVMTEVITEVSDMSKEFNMASVWAAQFNREATRRSLRGRGGLENIGLSDVVGQIVDIAFALGGTADEIRQHKRVLDIIKFRRGPVQSWLMEWVLSGETSLSVEGVYHTDGTIESASGKVDVTRRGHGGS